MQDIQLYEQGWADMMVRIWQERIDQLGIYRTGRLHSSISSHATTRQIAHTFLEYGIYVAAGTGRGYERGNGGDLPFLDPNYRHQHRLDQPRKTGPAWGGAMTSGHPRQRRDWFARKYYYSLRRLNDYEARYYGQAYQGLLTTALDQLLKV